MADERYRYMHCNMRLRHRYGMEMSIDEFRALCTACARGKLAGARVDPKGHVEGWLQLRGTWICVSYKPWEQLLGTVMPSPPPRPNVAPLVSETKAQLSVKMNEAVHAEAQRMLHHAMKSEQRPKWVGKFLPALQSVRARWSPVHLKRLPELFAKDPLEAWLYLDALASLPPSSSDKDIQNWILNEKPRWREANNDFLATTKIVEANSGQPVGDKDSPPVP